MSGDRVTKEERAELFGFGDNEIGAWFAFAVLNAIRAADGAPMDAGSAAVLDPIVLRMVAAEAKNGADVAREKGAKSRAHGYDLAQLHFCAVHNRAIDNPGGWRGMIVELADVREDELEAARKAAMAACRR